MPGHKVLVEIKVYKPILKGDIIKILGHKNDPGIDILSIVYEHGASVEFPKAVYEQIEEIPDTLDGIDIGDRVDLRTLLKASFKESGAINISFSWSSTATKPKPFLLIVRVQQLV